MVIEPAPLYWLFQLKLRQYLHIHIPEVLVAMLNGQVDGPSRIYLLKAFSSERNGVSS